MTRHDYDMKRIVLYIGLAVAMMASCDPKKEEILPPVTDYTRFNTSLEQPTETKVYLACFNNLLTRLDIDKHRRLVELMCDENQLTSLDVYNNTALEGLACFKNRLTSLDVSANRNLKFLACADNGLTVLDVSNNLKLEELYCIHNPSLTKIWLKTGQTIPELEYDTDVATLLYKP